MISQNEITVAILAGGKSKRFGSSKLYARYQNQTLIENAISIARKISGNLIVISGNNDIGFFDKTTRVISDLLPNKGPAGGLHTALAFSETKFTAIMPCDMPLLQPEIFRLAAFFSDGIHPVAALSDSGIEPLVSIWPARMAGKVQFLLQRNILSLHTILKELNALFIDVKKFSQLIDPDIFININSKQDLKKIQEDQVENICQHGIS